MAVKTDACHLGERSKQFSTAIKFNIESWNQVEIKKEKQKHLWLHSGNTTDLPKQRKGWSQRRANPYAKARPTDLCKSPNNPFRRISDTLSCEEQEDPRQRQ